MRIYLRKLRLSPVGWGFICLLLIPSATFMFLRTSSMTAGLLIAQVVWLALIASRNRGFIAFGLRRNAKIALVAVPCFVVALSLLSTALLVQPDFIRLIGSVAVALFSYICASAVALAIARLQSQEVKHVLAIEFWLMAAFAFAAMLGFPSLQAGIFDKSVFVFTERSHFALAFAPLLIFATAVNRGIMRWTILAIGTAIALGLQNLTAVVAVGLAACIVLSARNVLILIFIVAGILGFLNTDYYTSRLDFSSSAENLSAVVFLSGWERAVLNFKETYGIGVGFQQLGITGSNGQLMDVIELIADAPLNLNDGGSTAPKLIAEFGVCGVLILLAYCVVFVRALFDLRFYTRQRRHGVSTPVQEVVWNTFICAASIELFVRGIGYFSVGFFMLAVALVGKYRGRQPEHRFRDSRPRSPVGHPKLGAASHASTSVGFEGGPRALNGAEKSP